MRPPIFVRPPTDAEQQALQDGLRSSETFVLRRCQILRASARGVRVPQIAPLVGCDEQTVRNAIHAFNTTGGAALAKGASVPHSVYKAFDDTQAEPLRDLLHRSPRDFDH